MLGSVVFTDVSARACSLAGYPSIVLTSGTTRALPVKIRHARADLRPGTVVAPPVVVLEPARANAALVPLQWWNWCRRPPAPLTVRIAFSAGGSVPVVPESVAAGFAGVPGCLQASRRSSMLVAPVSLDRAPEATNSLADVTKPIATLGGFSGVEPGSIAFSGDAGNVVERIVWTAWNGSTAIGIGTWGYDDCAPNCARGTVSLFPATLTLSRPVGGAFTRLEERQSGPHGHAFGYTLPDSFLSATPTQPDAAVGAAALRALTRANAVADGQAMARVAFTRGDSLEQLSPQTESTWWAVVLDNASSESSVVRTVDSGAHWQNVTPPVSQVPVGSLSGDFLNADTGWIVAAPLPQSASPHSGQIYRTRDGGRSWRPLGSVPAGCQLDFVDQDDGWCSVLGAAAGSEAVRIYRTLDGGATWDLVSQTAVPEATSTPDALPFGCDKGLTFTSAKAGWASTACAAGQPALYNSDDGGARWVQLPDVPVPPGASTSGGWDMATPVVAGSRVAVAMTFGGGNGTSAVATSADGGQTWHTQVVPGLRQAPVADVVDQTHWIGTDGTVLVATDDGGTKWKTWKPAVAMRDADGSPLALDFLSPKLGWAGPRDSGGPLWWTTDGGRTWAPITITTSS